MPEGRMLKKAISDSKSLGKLKSDSTRLLYTWLIPQLDVEGRFTADPDLIKGHIFPKIKSMTAEKIKTLLLELAEVGLIILYDNGDEEYLQLNKFFNHQKLRTDREADSKIPAPDDEKSEVIKGYSGVSLENASLIKDNVREVNVREGKEPTPTERKILNELKKVKNYPYDFIDTLEYIRELAVDFPGIDILDEIQKKAAWWLDNPLTKKSNPHLQLRNWLKNAVKFNNERRGIDMVGGQSDNEKVMAHYEKQKAAGMFDDLDKEEY